jgi:pimeloyl-ACP methyl ester carboxylesterase
MLRTTSRDGVTVSYDRYGAGPPLLLVHGAFSDQRTNWELVKPLLEERFTVHAMARRGRGETDASVGHDLEDESRDVVAVIRAIGEPVFLLGHSYGAHTALLASHEVAPSIRRLVLYEPPWPHAIAGEGLARLEGLAEGRAMGGLRGDVLS